MALQLHFALFRFCTALKSLKAQISSTTFSFFNIFKLSLAFFKFFKKLFSSFFKISASMHTKEISSAIFNLQKLKFV